MVMGKGMVGGQKHTWLDGVESERQIRDNRRKLVDETKVKVRNSGEENKLPHQLLFIIFRDAYY